MKERRYKDSYRIVTDVDPRTGKAREVAEYAGEYFRWPPDGRTRLRRMLPEAAGVALYWGLALLHLRLASVTGRCIYALVPFMLGLFPGVYALMGLWGALRAPERMTLIQRENGPGRLVRAALGCGVFSSAGAVGCAVFLTVGGRWGAGWAEPLRALAAAAAAWAAFAAGRRRYRSIQRA